MQYVIAFVAIMHLIGGVVQGLIFIIFHPEKRMLGVKYIAIGVGVFVGLNLISYLIWGNLIS